MLWWMFFGVPTLLVVLVVAWLVTSIVSNIIRAFRD